MRLRVVLWLIFLIFSAVNLIPQKSLSINIMPFIEQMIIYHFVILRDMMVGYWFILFITVFQDAIFGLPIGVSSFADIVSVKITSFVNKRRVIIRNTKNIIVEYVLFLILFVVIRSCILSYYYKLDQDRGRIFLQLLVSVLLYPIFNRVAEKLLKKHGENDFEYN